MPSVDAVRSAPGSTIPDVRTSYHTPNSKSARGHPCGGVGVTLQDGVKLARACWMSVPDGTEQTHTSRTTHTQQSSGASISASSDSTEEGKGLERYRCRLWRRTVGPLSPDEMDAASSSSGGGGA